MSARTKKSVNHEADGMSFRASTSFYFPEVVDTKPEHKHQFNVHNFESWISSALDVFKGIFIIFMLTEHTRSAFSIGMTEKEPIMQFVSQVACALDMTCFSTAYGFSCYRSYLTNSKGRSKWSQFTRIFRSVGLICGAAWACNISFELTVLQNPPSWEVMRKIFSFDVVYWDFLTTFPAMLLTAFVTTKPLMALASRSSNQLVRIVIFAFLLCWPLLASDLAMDTCPTMWDRYKAIFIGCVRRTLGAMRFSAITYMFYFNFGCIVSFLTLEHSQSGAKPVSLLQKVSKPHWIGYAVLVSMELWFAVPLLKEYNRSWEYLDWEGYRRFPMTAPLTLAWGFLSQSVGLFALGLTRLARLHLPSLVSRTLHAVCHTLEHFGANVLLYLTCSNIIIHGLFQVDWKQFQLGRKTTKSRKSDLAYSISEWEWVVVAAAVGQILFVQLISYMIRSSRK